MLHDRVPEAEQVIETIERRVRASATATGSPAAAPMRFAVSSHTPFARMAMAILRDYPQRAALGLTLMAAQAFFYNAIFFSYALVLTRFYGVPAAAVGWYILPFALGNFLGPLALGPFFDLIGRKPMIGMTYALSGGLLAVVGWLFRVEAVNAAQLTLCWTGIFFFASAAASSAYLTVSESFPLEARALAIALFYALGTALGGTVSPWLFGVLVGSGERDAVFAGYLVGAGLMLAAALTEFAIGIKAERQPLESVARPLSSIAE
jgi:MFS family permease